MLVPALVREALPDAIIGYFHHLPWPSSEVFRGLAARDEILHGLLGADQISFQTYNHSRHFRITIARILGLETTPKEVVLEGRGSVGIVVRPIGIDVKMLGEKRAEPEVAEWVKILEERYQGVQLLVGRDKIEVVKGVKQVSSLSLLALILWILTTSSAIENACI